MATSEEYAQWIVDNADKKGTPEFNTVAKAYKTIRVKPIQSESPSLLSELGSQVRNLVAGDVAGAGDIGSTLITAAKANPANMLYQMAKNYGNSGGTLQDQITGNKPRNFMQKTIDDLMSSDAETRKGIQEGLTTLTGSDPNSYAYGGGRIATQIAGTAGVGDLLAGAKLLQNAPRLQQVVQSYGMRTGADLANAGVKAKLADLGVRAAGGAITGGASAAYVDPRNALSGMVAGAALPVATRTLGAMGDAAGKGASYLANTVRGNAISQEAKDLAARAYQLGIDIPADRLTNSKALDALASGLNYVPFSGRAGTETRMGKQLTKAASNLMGQDTDNLALALRNASKDLGAKFDTTLKNNTVKFDQTLLEDLTTAYNSAEKELGKDDIKAISNQVDEIISKGANGEIDGNAAYNIKKNLDRLGREGGNKSYHAIEIKKVLMNALDRSLGVDEAAAFAKTRQQYGNMLSLEKVAAKNGLERDISVSKLASLPNINNQPLQEIADIAAQFIKPREGMHGSAQRGFAALGIGGFSGLPGLAATATGGRVLNSGLNSNALKNFVLQDSIHNQQGLLGNAVDYMNPYLYRAAPIALSKN